MGRFLFAEYHGDDAGQVLAKMLAGDMDGLPVVQDERGITSDTERIVGFAPNPPELPIFPDPDETEPDDEPDE